MEKHRDWLDGIRGHPYRRSGEGNITAFGCNGQFVLGDLAQRHACPVALRQKGVRARKSFDPPADRFNEALHRSRARQANEGLDDGECVFGTVINFSGKDITRVFRSFLLGEITHDPCIEPFAAHEPLGHSEVRGEVGAVLALGLNRHASGADGALYGLFVFVYQGIDVAPDSFADLIAKHLICGLVERLDDARAVDHDNAVNGSLNNSAIALFAVHQFGGGTVCSRQITNDFCVENFSIPVFPYGTADLCGELAPVFAPRKGRSALVDGLVKGLSPNGEKDIGRHETNRFTVGIAEHFLGGRIHAVDQTGLVIND